MNRDNEITDKRRILGFEPSTWLNLHFHRSAWSFKTQAGVTVYGSTNSLKQHLGIPSGCHVRISRTRRRGYCVRYEPEDKDKLQPLFAFFEDRTFFSAFDSTSGVLLAADPRRRRLVLTRNLTGHYKNGTTHESFSDEPCFVVYTSALIGVLPFELREDVTYTYPSLEAIQKNI